MEYQKAFENLIGSFRKLPGVGSKSAERMAFYILEMEQEDVDELIRSLKDVRKDISKCPRCGILRDQNACPMCDNKNRDDTILAIVQGIKDVYTLERSQEYRGLYHVLNGLISPSNPASLNSEELTSLFNRIRQGKIKEVIIATNPTIEGETTALFIKKMLEPLECEITRLAYGLPVGGHIDYADDLTIARAFEGRRKF